MTIHEYGKVMQRQCLVHPSVVMGFLNIHPLLEKKKKGLLINYSALLDMMKMIHCSKILPAWKISPGNWQSG